MSTDPTISIVYITGRNRPMLDWALDGLELQAQPDDRIELIVVDALGRRAQDLTIRPTPGEMDYIDQRIRLIVIPPKPTVWQGPSRVTACDWWAASNARNTGLVSAHADHIVFMDDRCKLGPKFLETARENARSSSPRVLAGAYSKRQDGRVTMDHRRELHPAGKANCGGGWLFGCAVSIPTDWALEVNGYEEGCDGMSMEDVIFGLMLEHAGYPIDYSVTLEVEQERSAEASKPGYRRTDKGTSPLDKSHEALERFGKRKRTEFTPDLRELKLATVWPVPPLDPPARDWFDGQLISEMT